MLQYDLFEETHAKEIQKMRKWLARIEKRLWYLEQITQMKDQLQKNKQTASKVIEQLRFFGT